MKKTLSLFLALVLALSLLPANALAADTVTYKDSGGYKLSQSEIMRLMQEAPIYTPDNLFKTEPSVKAPYAPGELSDEALNAALDRFNLMRALAGLPSVTLDKDKCRDAQYGAVLLTTYYDHEPPLPADMDDDFYQKGYAVTSTSSICYHYSGGGYTNEITEAADGFMRDHGKKNLYDVGHRGCMMNPNLGKIGVGLARKDGTTEYVVHSLMDNSGPGIDYEFLAWPASGNFPRTVMTADTPWSVALNPDLYSRPQLRQVTVTLKRLADNKTWTFSSKSDADGFFYVSSIWSWENGAIIFKPDLSALSDVTELGVTHYGGYAGNESNPYYGVYTVTVSGIQTASGQDTTLSYQVDFFNDVPGSYKLTLDDGMNTTDKTLFMFTNTNGEAVGPHLKRNGYTFWDWYTEPDGNGTAAYKTVFTEDSTIYAYWKQPGVVTVNFDANGGTVDQSSIKTVNNLLPSLPVPTRPGYRFEGWYTNKVGSGKVTLQTTFKTNNATVYARWTPIPTAFTDVAPGDWYADAVDWAVRNNVTAGTSDTTFSPNDTCTQGQILTFLWRAKGEPAPAGAVSGTEYYAKAAQWAKEQGLTDSFSANADCTRAMVVTYLWKLAGSPKAVSSSGFTDVPASLTDAVSWASARGITAGTSDTTFSPDMTCTRAQIVTFLYRAYGYSL